MESIGGDGETVMSNPDSTSTFRKTLHKRVDARPSVIIPAPIARAKSGTPKNKKRIAENEVPIVKVDSKKKKSPMRRSNPPAESNVVPAAIKQAKEDLMHLGIELDDDLIARLQNNLGIEKIFEVARNCSKMLRPQHDIGGGPIAEMQYRYVSNSSRHVGFSLNMDQKQPIHSSLQPFVSDMILVDPRHSVHILQQLDNRADEIEPHHRPQLDAMIENFRLQYARAPVRFIGRLLGRNWNHATDRTQEDALITRWILRTRYVSQQDFVTMVKRVAPTAKAEVIETLFSLLREEKQFGTPNRREIVDLWSFLTLLKTASDESRRSYDGRKSKIATDVEFWRRDNSMHLQQLQEESVATLALQQNDHEGREQRERKRVPLREEQAADPCGWRIFENRSNVQRPRLSKDISRPGTSTVAALLDPDSCEGHRRLQHQPAAPGRVMGRLQNEMLNTCDIPSALNSPPILHRRAKSPSLPHQQLEKEHALPLAPPQYAHDSRGVTYLLNNQDLLKQTSIAADGKKVQSFHTLQRELLNNTSMAAVLGGADRPPQPPQPAINNRRRNNTLADMMISHLQQSVVPTSNSTRPKAAAGGGGPVRSLSASRLRMTSAISLHWEQYQPSVAAALGQGNLL